MKVLGGWVLVCGAAGFAGVAGYGGDVLVALMAAAVGGVLIGVD